MKEFSYVVTDLEGIHARPAGMLTKEAGKFASTIKITKGDKISDAKKIFAVMGLGVKKGESVKISAEGADESAAIGALQDFFKRNL
ncbi:HPr family phosphocarrier protein [Caproiciproducens sp. CPB-2]|uniref:HPr family phosphocarrier protein n=1 Tax=Caproiciproducens sp. CPB-2 TaxID=3030017 RepID=UPI0023DBAB98|nr:HPr family phosphocarrier protein [Caproiciproducens sp. CPB-2]MDF1493154.1 HPr family phosphocarrier protein [Caproiciproducens sp. CPB-2]